MEGLEKDAAEAEIDISKELEDIGASLEEMESEKAEKEDAEAELLIDEDKKKGE